jgi:hypothetical protein
MMMMMMMMIMMMMMAINDAYLVPGCRQQTHTHLQ